MFTKAAVPEVGQAVRVRNRLATVRAVEPYDARTQGRLHIIDLEYLDDFRYPEGEQLLWEIEATAEPLGKTSLPSVDANRNCIPTVFRGLSCHSDDRRTEISATVACASV